MWPFTGKPMGKTVAEQRKEAAANAARLATDIGNLQAQVIALERKIPYVRSHNEKKQLELRKLRIEEKIKQLEEKHHALMRV